MYVDADDFLLIALCASCIQANTRGNLRRLEEIQETINGSDWLADPSSKALTYCDSKKPIVRDCKFAECGIVEECRQPSKCQ